MNYIDFYTGLLKAAGLGIDDNGGILTAKGNHIQIEEKEFYLPTDEVLKNKQNKDFIAFHPICESAVRSKDSPVFKKLKLAYTARLNAVTVDLLMALMTVATSADLHEKLPPKAMKMLKVIDKVDEKTLSNLRSVCEELSFAGRGEKTFVSIYPKRNGKLHDKSYRRLAVVSFPIMQEREHKEYSLFGKKVRKDDKAAILNLMEYILPGCEVDNAYSEGSNSMVAPGFTAMTMAFVKVLSALQEKVELFKDFIPDVEEVSSDLEWVDGMESLSKYNALLPPLEGNQGDVTEEEQASSPVGQPKASERFSQAVEEEVPSAKAPAPAPAPASPTPYNAPQQDQRASYNPHQPDTTPQDNGGKVDWRNASRPVQPNSPYGAQQPQYQQVAADVPPWQQGPNGYIDPNAPPVYTQPYQAQQRQPMDKREEAALRRQQQQQQQQAYRPHYNSWGR